MTFKKIFSTIGLKEWQFVGLLVLVVIVISTLPMIYGWLNTPESSFFTGIHFGAPNDWFVYYSYIQQVKQGDYLFSDLFTGQHSAPFLNVLWLLVGLFSKVFRLSVVSGLNIARVLSIPVLYFVSYLFFAYIFSSIKLRRLSMLIFAFGSGLGWMLINRLFIYPYNYAQGRFNWPMDLWVPESNTFLTTYYSPHFVISLTLIILTIFLLALAAENKNWRYAFFGGLSGLVLFSFHPFHVLSVFSVIFFYYLVLMVWQKKWQWSLVGYYAFFGFVSAPAILYYFYLLLTDPVTQQKALQNLTWTTPFWVTLFSYGLILVFAIVGIYFLIKNNKIDRAELLLIVWLLVGFAAIYSPVDFQRRMTAGLQIPMIALSAIGLVFLYDWLKQSKGFLARSFFDMRFLWLSIIIIFFLISNAFQIASDIFIYKEHLTFAYISQDEFQAAIQLKGISKTSVVFNSSQGILNFLPAYCGCHVYVGHGVETPDFRQKQLEVEWLFSKNRNQETERAFFKNRDINYVYYSPAEKKLGSYNPKEKTYLKKIFSNKTVSIYQVL